MNSLSTFFWELLPSLISLIITGIILGWMLDRIFGNNSQTIATRKLNFKKYYPHIISVVVFIIMMSGLFFYTMRCNNGQVSWNIGKQGACSHNDGVKKRYPTIIFDIVYSVSLIAYAVAENYKRKSLAIK